MEKPEFIMAIDQGTSSSRAILFNREGRVVQLAQREFPSFYPRDGWVEQSPEVLWETTLAVCREVLAKASLALDAVFGIGITNQRETTIVWDRVSGEAIYPAIVWQDRRTAAACAELRLHPSASQVVAKTGLLLDPYFSASKIAWILDHVPGARERAERGELAFGTVDCFLLWRLTNGTSHFTDATNASRTQLFNIETQDWDQELLDFFSIPAAILPQVRDNAADFGRTKLFGGSLPILALVGDQQAAAIGQACFSPGMVKSTFGTGCFVMLNTGTRSVHSKNNLLTTVAYRLKGETHYALEGSIFIAGAALKWLRDRLLLIPDAAESLPLAQSVEDTGGVYFVPAFTGLGAPYWDPDARAAILGLTLDSGIAQIVRAALEAVAFQSLDLVNAMLEDGADIRTLRVDGGMANNPWFLAFLANMLDIPVERPEITETTAQGAALLAAHQLGWFEHLEDGAAWWRAGERHEPAMEDEMRQRLYQGWLSAVARVRVQAT